MNNLAIKRIVNRQKTTLKNLELLESLRVLKQYFPSQYKRKVIDLGNNQRDFYFDYINGKYVIPRGFSIKCSTHVNKVSFENYFKAMEFIVISILNGRTKEETSECEDLNCEYCDNRFRS